MTWEELQNEIKNLAMKINYTPDIVVGIIRGGLIPARLLSNELNVKNMHCLTVKKVGADRKVMTDILEDVSGKKILLVEDMLETGKSLQVAQAYLEAKGAEVKTACLYTMPISDVKPDYSLKEISEIIKFPWEGTISK
ncbi:hypothetical protein A2853_03360 [Candidatus Kaiserbacteria bacterium RIFCSPHIGHO2_01_FULL_55_17]|uniref:Phosphoribosyltransferase domain-containing protein n=1 Tax=Candidatus Kaiserbacteria bacterium RIFCSPHIGHO2_01_FULL_55_17 TaxID=1798484 RepID=A0A1F6D9E4_9BACT|nr:MAG: hypothetical protein A2853_03360 [Candidatus Kaiserbacteria bacterium RIFCSPHIGHO2_01_FULL_55_17]